VTTADVSVLTGPERVTEIARMLGGDAESDVSRAHAQELLESAAAPELAGTGASANGTAAPQRTPRRKR
jgi:DNA repair protein RecN (Recombination protein N)